jgi:hypothetical protein
MFAETQNFLGLAAHVEGPLDVDALSDAFDLLLQAHPVLAGHLDKDPEGRWEIVLDDLLHPGIEVIEADSDAATPAPLFDQCSSLVHLRVIVRDGQAQPTFYIHHSLADGHHQFSLIEELFSTYTDLVTTGSARPVTVHPAPDPMEKVLTDRNVERKDRSGLERMLGAMFVYDLPPSRRAAAESNPAVPQLIPMVSCTLAQATAGNSGTCSSTFAKVIAFGPVAVGTGNVIGIFGFHIFVTRDPATAAGALDACPATRMNVVSSATRRCVMRASSLPAPVGELPPQAA